MATVSSRGHSERRNERISGWCTPSVQRRQHSGPTVLQVSRLAAPAEVREIVLAGGELAGFEFVTAVEAAGLVPPLVARRIAACLDACEAGTVAALENGSPTALRRAA